MPRKPLSDDKIKEIRDLKAKGLDAKAISQAAGVSHATAWRYATGNEGEKYYQVKEAKK